MAKRKKITKAERKRRADIKAFLAAPSKRPSDHSWYGGGKKKAR